MRKSLKGHDQSESNWQGIQDISACEILSHSSHAFWRTTQETQIRPVSRSQNDAKKENTQTVHKIL